MAYTKRNEQTKRNEFEVSRGICLGCFLFRGSKKRRTDVIPFRNEACGEKVISFRLCRMIGWRYQKRA